MATKRFNPQPTRCYTWSGAASGDLDPGREAIRIGVRFHGAWLTAYMIRRFGPPNHPSDDRKSLCSWMLTTPMDGLALLVTPYLGDQGDSPSMCLHFGYRWSKKVAAQVRRDDPGTKEYWKLCEVVWRWQRRKVVGFLVTDAGDRKLLKILEQNQPTNGERRPDFGLYWAKPRGEVRGVFVTKKEFYRLWSVRHAIVDAYDKQHPRKPRNPSARGRRPESAIVRRCNFALRASIRALLLPIWVRDVCFSATGLRDDCPHGQRSAEPFVDAGWACRVDK